MPIPRKPAPSSPAKPARAAQGKIAAATGKRPSSPVQRTGASTKPRVKLRPLREARPLTNSADHTGREVMVILAPYRGQRGRITSTYTAVHEKHGWRGSYCTIELERTIIEGVDWSEFITVSIPAPVKPTSSSAQRKGGK